MVDCKWKFNEWVKKISDTLVEGKFHELPAECKYLRYWHRKIGVNDPELFLQLEAPVTKLLRESIANMLGEGSSNVEEARRHRENTKIRFNTLMKFVYNYEHYIHPLIMKINEKQLAFDTMRVFNDERSAVVGDPLARLSNQSLKSLLSW